jgi:hypothetical protein
VNFLRGLSIRLSLLALLAALPAAAALSARLVYLRSGTAETCPDQAALKKAVARRLGYDPFLVAARYTIVAEVSGNGGDLRARARLLDESGIVLGSRELLGKGTDCAELLASLALAISLTLDPMAPATDTGPEPPEERVAAEDSAKPGPVEPVVTPELKRELTPERKAPNTTPIQTIKTTSLSLQAGMLGSVGWVPALSPGAELGLVLQHRRWSLGLDAIAVASQTRASAEGLSARVSVAYAAVSPCFWVSAVGVCALGTWGRYAGQGEGVDAPRAGNHLHSAAGARIQALLPLSARWSLGMHADGVLILTRPQFLVAGQEVFRPAPWAANLGFFGRWQMF